MYLWGNIAPYVISYFYHFGGPDGTGQTGVSVYDAVYVMPIVVLMMAFMNPTGAFLFKVANPKILIAIGCSMGVSAMCIAAFVDNFASYVLCFGVMYGAGTGLCYFPPLGCGWEWVPERKGLVTGIILGAYGLAAFVFSFISRAVVNPENVSAVEQDDGT